jgi:hypothetical protein
LAASPIASQQEALSTYLREVHLWLRFQTRNREKHTDIPKEGPTLASHRYHKWWSGGDCCQGQVGQFHWCFTSEASRGQNSETKAKMMNLPSQNALQRNMALGHIWTHSALLPFELWNYTAQNS